MIIVGVDGGGTKTHALAVDEHGALIGVGIGGASNYHIRGLTEALGVIADAVTQATQGRRADMIAYCLTACDSDIDERRLTDGLRALDLSERLVCFNDGFAALRAGTARPYGVVVICGTGFNAGGIAPDGRQAKLHSLGALTGDWGGGYSLGESVCAAVFRADEGRGQATILTGMLLTALDIPDLTELAYRIVDRTFGYAESVTLAPLVFEAARAGDAVAQGIVRRQADEIVTAAGAIIHKLDMRDLEMDVVLAGGVISGSGGLLPAATQAQIVERYPKAQVCQLEVLPVIGATYLAFDALGIVPEQALPSLDASVDQRVLS